MIKRDFLSIRDAPSFILIWSMPMVSLSRIWEVAPECRYPLGNLKDFTHVIQNPMVMSQNIWTAPNFQVSIEGLRKNPGTLNIQRLEVSSNHPL